jgi:hypothetical protein
MKMSALKFFKILLSSIIFSSFWASGSANAQANYTASTGWGTYYNLFAANSPWNIRPINPALGNNQVKKPLYNPTWIPGVSGGAYSVQVFMATAKDPAVTIYGYTSAGVGDPDTGKHRNITLPHWPANVVPASGSDGHADIVDTVTGVIHSFFQLRKINGRWTAAMYSWTRVDGTGWGDPEHWSQGSRASGTVPAGGLIRLHEVDDNASHYKHALSMSLPAHTLANGITRPSYVAPATTTDYSAFANTGVIPMGARLMLPANFDTSTIRSLQLRKVANTLKLYGAFVVDRNYDTAFAIFVENGGNFKLMPNGWDGQVVADLEKIRAGLREMVKSDGWIDGNGAILPPQQSQSLLSMRGAWMLPASNTVGTGAFNTWEQAIVFPYTTKKLSHVNYSTGVSKVSWSTLKAGTPLRFKAEATGGATIRMQVRVNNIITLDTGYLHHGTSSLLNWPNPAAGKITIIMFAESGINTVSKARGILTAE